jgi:hypothetical protein
MKNLTLILTTLILTTLILTSTLHAYKYDSGQYYMSGGLGANVNVVRHEGREPTPKAAMPLYMTLDYAVDKNFGVFATFAPQFSGSAVSFLTRAGAKYWMTFMDAPYVPYVSLALTPALLWPTGQAKSHVNLGISPGVGINFFVMANFLVGMHLNLNPSIAMVNNERHFELAVSGLLDVSFRI